MQATVAVYTSGSIGSSEGDSVSFPWCSMKSTSGIQYSQRPVAGYNVCSGVGGPDVKICFVTKFDVTGSVWVSFLVGRELKKLVLLFSIRLGWAGPCVIGVNSLSLIVAIVL